MNQISTKIKEGLINKVSKNLLLEIKAYIPFKCTLNIFRHSKKYQEYLNINISTYQKWFINNKLKFDFDFINNDNLLSFFQKEFHNFTSEEDKAFFIKIIEEIRNEKKIKESISHIPSLIRKNIQYEENLIWREDKNINYLILGYEYICRHGSKFRITDESEQKIIPSQCFPNVKVISIENNFIIPASMMKNLVVLDIRPFSRKKILFYNDIGEEEMELNNLESFVISRNRIYTSCLIKEPKNSDINYDIKFKFKNLE